VDSTLTRGLTDNMGTLIKTYYSRQWASIKGSRAARLVNLPTGWGRLRVGILAALSGAVTETLDMGIGFCSGTTNILGDATTTHWIGARSTGAWTYSSGGYVTGTVSYYKRVGTTYTGGGGLSGYDISDVGTRDHVCGMWVDIVKGSPNYTVEIVWYDTVPSGSNSLSVSVFLSKMSIAKTLNGSQPSGYYFHSGAVACSESTDGYFDAVNISWPGPNTSLCIDRMVISCFSV